MNIQNILIDYIARLVDGFKTKNPLAFFAIVVTLVTVFVVLDSGLSEGWISDFALFGISEFLGTLKYWLLALIGMTGAHTTNYMKERNIEKWANDKDYFKDQKVKQEGVGFICQQNHRSTFLNQPLVDSAQAAEYWKKA